MPCEFLCSLILTHIDQLRDSAFNHSSTTKGSLLASRGWVDTIRAVTKHTANITRGTVIKKNQTCPITTKALITLTVVQQNETNSYYKVLKNIAN